MYLHEDQDMFIDAIQKTREETGIEPAIIEKDYYVSMMLRLLAASNIGFVFKGGTSLSKAYIMMPRMPARRYLPSLMWTKILASW